MKTVVRGMGVLVAVVGLVIGVAACGGTEESLTGPTITDAAASPVATATSAPISPSRTIVIPTPVPTPAAIPTPVCALTAKPRLKSQGHDGDGDGLIEVSTLEQLDAIRYDADGDGRADKPEYAEAYASTYPGDACTGCVGYELVRSLDFKDPGSYADGAVRQEWTKFPGWEPLFNDGSGFNALFEGNGNTISNLYIYSANGLFSRVRDCGVVRGLGLLDVKMSRGVFGGGAMIDLNEGRVIGSYATGNILDIDTEPVTRGAMPPGFSLLASPGMQLDSYPLSVVGGLVGYNKGTIKESYTEMDVDGGSYVGGLVGFNSGSIIAGYATGKISSEHRGREGIGGLVGANQGTIIAAYYAGSSEHPIELAGDNTGVILASYSVAFLSGESYQIYFSGKPLLSGKLSSDLQSPTSYTGIYADWHTDLDNADGDNDTTTGIDDFWDFGNSSQYPALKADINGDGVATWQEFGNQR